MALYPKERMSVAVKWIFTLPLSYVIYFAFSLLVPQVGFLSLVLRYVILIGVFLMLCRTFLGFDVNRFINYTSSVARFSFGRFFCGLGLMLALLAAITGVQMLISPSSFEFTFNSSQAYEWALSFIIVVLAALAEELLFRAYPAFFAGRQPVLTWGCCLASAVLFSLAHFQNPEVSTMGLASMAFYFVFGAVLMIYYCTSGGIEFGLGLHVGNNLAAAWLVTYPSAVLKTNALFTGSIAFSIAGSFIACAVLLALFPVLRKKLHA